MYIILVICQIKVCYYVIFLVSAKLNSRQIYKLSASAKLNSLQIYNSPSAKLNSTKFAKFPPKFSRYLSFNQDFLVM